MSDKIVVEAVDNQPPVEKAWFRHRFVWMLVGVFAVTIIFSGISLKLYVLSGTAQLDLSRPGYESVWSKIDDEKVQTFDSAGPIDTDTLTEFQNLYDVQLKKTNVTQFDSDALVNSALGIESIPDATH